MIHTVLQSWLIVGIAVAEGALYVTPRLPALPYLMIIFIWPILLGIATYTLYKYGVDAFMEDKDDWPT